MGDSIKLSFSKSERLRNVQQIAELFRNPVSIKAFPLIFNYIYSSEVQQTSVQLLFSAPKRNFKKAVARNRVKRLLRDRLRLQKPALLEALGEKKIAAAIICIGKEIPSAEQLDRSIQKIIKKLHDQTGA